MPYESLEYTVTDGVAHIHLSRPETGNRFDRHLCSELSLVATECDEDPSVRAVLVDASGPYFSVGADLESFLADRERFAPFIKNATAGLHTGISRFARGSAPVIVAVHALAVGGAVALAAGGDFCIAARSARFYAAYTGIGLIPDGAATFYLPRRVGARKATEFFMLNQTWSAEDAVRFGLATEVVDDDALSDTAWALARRLAVGPTAAYGELKNLLLSTWEQPLEAQLEQEARAMARCTHTDDAWNAVGAVARKERPVFAGR